MARPSTQVTIPCIQMEPRIPEPRENLAHSLEMIAQAASLGAGLVVLPELCNSGYVFETQEEALALAEDPRTGRAAQGWAKAAKQHDLYVIAGLNEWAGERIYDAAVVIGPDRVLGVFRKIHLWDRENLFFARGDAGYPVFDLPFGRVGTFICYDGWFPESYRLCAVQNADLVCIPTNWVPMPGQPRAEEVMANTLVRASAHCSGVFVAAADRVGTERGQPFLGRSLIVGPRGWVLAGPASDENEDILTAAVDLAEARKVRTLNAHNQLLADRRVDVYGESLAVRL